VNRAQSLGVEMKNKINVRHFQGISTCVSTKRWTRRRSGGQIDKHAIESGATQRHALIDFEDGAQHLGTGEDENDHRLEDDPRMMVYLRSIETEGEYNADGDRIPYYWPPFRNGTPETLTPVTTEAKWVPCPCRVGCRKRLYEENVYEDVARDPGIVVTKSNGFHEFVGEK
jgi:hypothetical protein